MSALVSVFGVPERWRSVVPVAAFVSVVGLTIGLGATPSVAADPLPAVDGAAAAADAELTAPDAVSAAAIARLEDRPVEVLGERTELGSVYALPDGSMVSGQGAGPVWVRQGGDGTQAEDWAAVDLTLVQGEDGLVRPVAHSGSLVLSGEFVPTDSAADAAAGGGTLEPSPEPTAGPAPEVVDEQATGPAAAPVPDAGAEPTPHPSATDAVEPDAPPEVTATEGESVPEHTTDPDPDAENETDPVEAPTATTSPEAGEPSTSAPGLPAPDPLVEESPRPPAEAVSPDADGSTDPLEEPLVDLASVTDPQTGAVTRLGWSGPLPEPRLEGRRAVYEEVRPSTDLVIEATSTGFAQYLVVKERPVEGDELTFPLTVTSTGTDLSVDPDGQITVTSEAGDVVASAPTPIMWDATADAGRAFPVTVPREAEPSDAPRLSPMPDYLGTGASAPATPSQQAQGDVVADPTADAVVVERSVVEIDEGTAAVELAPSADFLQDSGTVYPVVIDPDININMGWDTYVQSDSSRNLSEETELRVGTYNGGGVVARSFIHFATSAFSGKHVYSATMELFNFYSYSCQARNSQVYNVDPSSAATRWGNQGTWWNLWATSSDTHGYSSACGPGWTDYDITSLAQRWSTSNPTEGHVGVRAENEKDSAGWKRFYSSNNGSYIPSIWVRYNQTPAVPSGLKVSDADNGTVSGAWARSAVPVLYATVSDPDGGLVHGLFEVANSAQQVISSQEVRNLPSGTVASIRVPAGLTANGGTYYFRVRTSDGMAESARTAWFKFGVDTTAPLAPIITSTDYPNDNTWHKGEGQAGVFDFKPAAADASLVKYRWALDKAPDPAQTLTAFTTVKSSGLAVTPPTAGRHVLQVQAVDRAGNASAVVKYAFNVGRAGLVTPDDGTRVVSRARLQVSGESVFTHVKYQWRRGPDSPAADVRDIPLAQLSTSAGQAWATAWAPIPGGADGYSTWDVGEMLGAAGGPVQVRAVVATSAAGAGAYSTSWITLTVDPDATGAATTEIGPGTVNLLTGDHGLTVTDVEEFGMSLVRSTSSRDTDSGYETQLDKLSLTQQQGSAVTDITGAQGVVSVATNQFHTGKTSLKVLPPASPATTDTYVSPGGDSGANRLGMLPGRTYRVSGWVYLPSASGQPAHVRGATMSLFTRVGTGAYQETRTKVPTATNTWQQVTMDVTVPAGATESFLRLYNGFASGSGKAVYFDDISVRELWAPFGKEWSSGTVDGAAGTAYTRISRPYTDVASVHLTGGGEVWFTSGDGTRWWPEPGAEDLSLTPVSATTWRLTEIDGTTTDFVQTAGTKDFPVSVTTVPAASGAARHIYDVSVPGQSRLSRLIAPIEDGVDGWPANKNACNPAPGVAPARGCEVMDISYSTTTTATATSPGTAAGQVDSIGLWGTEPSTGVVSKVAVARYLYDGNRRLSKVWDPRIGTSTAAAPGAGTLVTTYGYDAAGRVTSATAPGEEPYRFSYGPGGTTRTGAGDFVDASSGRLLKVSRRSLVPGTLDQWGPDNVSTVVYSVPLSRSLGGPYDLRPAELATWAQTDGPTDATAVFGPQDPPGVTTAFMLAPGRDGYGPATVHYLNSAGQEVNTASPAGPDAPVEGFIDTAEHDRFGNVVRTLDATNRLLALGRLPESTDLASWGLGGSGSAYLSQVLDTRSRYSNDGLDLIATRGPAQQLAVSNDPDTLAVLHSATRYDYDQGKPDGSNYHLVTQETSGGLPVGADPVSGALADPLVTVNGYNPVDGASVVGPTSGWVHKQPTSVTVDAGQPTTMTSKVTYDNRGRIIRSSKPGSTGNDSATTVAVYYTAAANTADVACANRPEWAGQPCSTKIAGAITGHDPSRMASQLPVRRVTAYNRWGTATVVNESVAGPLSGATVTQARTTTTTVDGADRITQVSITGTGAGVGESVSSTQSVYDATTGEVVAVRAVAGTGTVLSETSKEYDRLGRLVTYRDGAGATTTTEYSRFGEPVSATDSVTDAFGSRTIGTVAYTYDRSVDPRGYVTSFTDSVAGTFGATWGPDGQLESQSLPGDVTLRISYDPARVPVARTYTRTSDGVLIAADSVVENHRGQWVKHSSDTGVRTYGYDRLGRLSSVTDKASIAGACTTRGYGYDTHANRTQFASATGEAAADCPTADLQSTATYDSVDRLVTSVAGGDQWRYDPLGRVVSMPSATAGGTAVENGFYVNDLVSSQTIPGESKVAWTLDTIQRRSGYTTSAWVDGAWADAVTKVSHYGSDSDEPGWIAEDASLPEAVTRYVSGVEGDVAMTTSLSGDRELQLVDLHGDIVATLPIADTEPSAQWAGLRFTSFDEFGVPQPLNGSGATTGPPARYGWLGAAQRSAEALNGVILMGVRLYSPEAGRFLSVDSIAGGSSSAYDYCNADPVNCTDLAGTWSWRGIVKTVAKVGEIASIIPGPIGAAAAGVSSLAYAATGNKKKALSMAATVAIAAVGAGSVWAAVKVGRASRDAYHAVKVVRAAAKTVGNGPGRGQLTISVRSAKWAGKLWTVGGRTTSIGGRLSKNGLRSYRPPSYKAKLGYAQANFQSRRIPKKYYPNNYHVRIR